MPGFVAVNSSQMEKITKGWVAVDGQMKEITKGWVYEGGNWKQIFDKDGSGVTKTLGDLEIGTVVLVEESENGYAEWRIVANAGDHYYLDENRTIPATGMKVLMREKFIGSIRYMDMNNTSTKYTHYSN